MSGFELSKASWKNLPSVKFEDEGIPALREKKMVCTVAEVSKGRAWTIFGNAKGQDVDCCLYLTLDGMRTLRDKLTELLREDGGEDVVSS